MAKELWGGAVFVVSVVRIGRKTVASGKGWGSEERIKEGMEECGKTKGPNEKRERDENEREELSHAMCRVAYALS